MTPLEQFQHDHLNHLGQRLDVDNTLGPQTRWARAIACQHPFRQQVVERGLLHVGVAEDPLGSNRGKLIDYWLERCGLKTPPAGVAAPDHAWCAAFVSYCLSVPGYEEVKLARVVDLVRKYDPIPFEETLPGDLGYFIYPGTEKGHIWILTGRDDASRQTMQVEGNTGNKVAVTRRPECRYLRTMPPPIMPGIPPGVGLAATQTR